MCDFKDIPFPDPKTISYQNKSNLIILEKESWPFPASRIFFIKDVKGPRGDHAHKKTWQYVFPLTGSVQIDIDNPRGGWTYYREASDNKGVLVPPLNWLKLFIHTPDTIIGVLCSQEYDESDYLRTWPKYQDYINAQNSL